MSQTNQKIIEALTESFDLTWHIDNFMDFMHLKEEINQELADKLIIEKISKRDKSFFSFYEPLRKIILEKASQEVIELWLKKMIRCEEEYKDIRPLLKKLQRKLTKQETNEWLRIKEKREYVYFGDLVEKIEKIKKISKVNNMLSENILAEIIYQADYEQAEKILFYLKRDWKKYELKNLLLAGFFRGNIDSALWAVKKLKRSLTEIEKELLFKSYCKNYCSGSHVLLDLRDVKPIFPNGLSDKKINYFIRSYMNRQFRSSHDLDEVEYYISFLKDEQQKILANDMFLIKCLEYGYEDYVDKYLEAGNKISKWAKFYIIQILPIQASTNKYDNLRNMSVAFEIFKSSKNKKLLQPYIYYQLSHLRVSSVKQWLMENSKVNRPLNNNEKDFLAWRLLTFVKEIQEE